MYRPMIATVLAATFLAGGLVAASTAHAQTQKACVSDSTKIADPLQACAAKALRGDFGTIPNWKLKVYQKVAAQGLTAQGKAWVTSYYPSEGFPRGQHTRSGIGVSERSAAVYRRDWKRLRGCYVWTAAYGLRVVEDTGANSNHRHAIRNNADIWLDYWFPRPMRGNPVTAYAFIPKSK